MKEFPRNSGGKASPPCGRDSGMTMGGILLRLDWGRCGRQCIDHGSGQTRMPPQSDGTQGFLVWGDSFTRLELGNDTGLMGALIAVCFECCCGGMCWPRERAMPRMPPQERQHDGSWVFAAARGGGEFRNDRRFRGRFFHTLGSGQTRMPPQERRHEGFRYFVGSIVGLTTEGGCGGMSLADGPAARGVFV